MFEEDIGPLVLGHPKVVACYASLNDGFTEVLARQLLAARSLPRRGGAPCVVASCGNRDVGQD